MAVRSHLLGTNNRAISQIQSMIKEMPYITEHLSSLRQEIADLRNLNARFTEKGDHSALDQTALELRTNRLREIKLELSQMLNRPDDPKVWWERARRGHLQALSSSTRPSGAPFLACSWREKWGFTHFPEH